MACKAATRSYSGFYAQCDKKLFISVKLGEPQTLNEIISGRLISPISILYKIGIPI
jgi:hypothetical protein